MPERARLLLAGLLAHLHPRRHRDRPQRDQPAQVAVAHLAHAPEPRLAAGRSLPGHQPEPGGELPPAAEQLGVRHRRAQGHRAQRAEARDHVQSPRPFVLAQRRRDQPVELADLLADRLQSLRQRQQRRPHDERKPVAGAQPADQFEHRGAALRHHDAEFRKMAAQRVQQLGALPHQQIARLEQHQTALLLDALHRDAPHLRIARRTGDGAGVLGVVLLARQKRLHPRRRDQPHLVSEPLQLARPVMRAAAGLEADAAALDARELLEHLGPLHRLLQNRPARNVEAVQRKARLCDVQSNGANVRHGGWLL